MFAKSMSAGVRPDIKNKADEYIGSLAFDRLNKSRSDGKDVNSVKLEFQAKREVQRFVVEYGLAGLAIKRIYKNPVICFTEPSGYIRGYFYNAFLKKKDGLPVLYLC